jgi:hypothetical protein
MPLLRMAVAAPADAMKPINRFAASGWLDPATAVAWQRMMRRSVRHAVLVHEDPAAIDRLRA